MRKLYILGVAALAGLIIGLAWAEQITLSTYYPAPYGVYRQMQTTVTKLVPSDGPPDFISGNEEEGMLYFDNGTTNAKGLCYWDSDADAGVGAWLTMRGGGLVSFLDSPLRILDESLTPGADVSISGNISTGLEIDVSGVVPSEAQGLLLAISSSFTANDDNNAIQQFFAWSNLPAIPSFNAKSPYLVFNSEAGKPFQEGGEGDWDHAGAANTFLVPLTNGKFELIERNQQIYEEHPFEWSLTLMGYL